MESKLIFRISHLPLFSLTDIIKPSLQSNQPIGSNKNYMFCYDKNSMKMYKFSERENRNSCEYSIARKHVYSVKFRINIERCLLHLAKNFVLKQTPESDLKNDKFSKLSNERHESFFSALSMFVLLFSHHPTPCMMSKCFRTAHLWVSLLWQIGQEKRFPVPHS